MSVTQTPWIIVPELHILFVKILSIRVADFAVTLVGRVINGTSMLLYIKQKMPRRTVGIRIHKINIIITHDVNNFIFFM